MVKLYIEDGEYWWGGRIADGIYMPFHNQIFHSEMSHNKSPNQAVPLLISSKGRYLWSDKPFDFKFTGDNIEIINNYGEISLKPLKIPTT